MESILTFNPTVCVVGKTYQIIVITKEDALISVRVGEKIYYYHSNGIRISSAGVHKFSVPADDLNKERSYTVIAKKLAERPPYFPEPDPAIEKTYEFYPLEKTDDISIYHLADIHGRFQQAVDIFNHCGKPIDLLILNGDIACESVDYEQMALCHKIASEIAKGEIPCLITRGNHELRGKYAEHFDEYLPTDCGKTYYTFRIGSIWGMVLDAGEDKNDDYAAYGGTTCFHDFRLEEDKMIHSTIENANCEYEEDGIKYKIIVSHVPFTFKKSAEKFDIERELFASWGKTIKDNIKPHVMICGHTHKACISQCGSEYDDLGQPCTVIVGSQNTKVSDTERVIAGAYINIKNNLATVSVNTDTEVLFEEKVNLE